MSPYRPRCAAAWTDEICCSSRCHKMMLRMHFERFMICNELARVYDSPKMTFRQKMNNAKHISLLTKLHHIIEGRNANDFYDWTCICLRWCFRASAIKSWNVAWNSSKHIAFYRDRAALGDFQNRLWNDLWFFNASYLNIFSIVWNMTVRLNEFSLQIYCLLECGLKQAFFSNVENAHMSPCVSYKQPFLFNYLDGRNSENRPENGQLSHFQWGKYEINKCNISIFFKRFDICCLVLAGSQTELWQRLQDRIVHIHGNITPSIAVMKTE